MSRRDDAPIQREQWLLPLLCAVLLALLEVLQASGHRIPGGGAAVTLLVVYTGYRAGIVAAMISAGLVSLFIIRSVEAGLALPVVGVVILVFSIAILVGWLSGRQRAALAQAVRSREAALRSETRYRELVQGLDAVVWEADADSFKVSFVSKQAEALFGYSVSEWIDSAQIWRRLIHAEDLEGAMHECRRAVSLGTNHDVEYRCVTRSGETLHIRNVVQIDNKVQPPVLRGVMVDVTSERRARTALQDTERKLRAFINNAPEALIVSDASGTIVEVNRRACEMLGYSRDEFLSRTVVEIDGKSDASATSGWGSADFVRGQHAYETVFRRKNGTTLPVTVSVSLWENAEPMLFIAMARDITRKNQLEMQLRQAQRMEALGRLAGGVAHDFNNLLTAIRGHADLLRDDPHASVAAELQEISGAADRAAGLTRQLLAFSRQQTLQMQVLDLNSVVDDMQKLLARLIGENITLITAFDHTVPAIEADRTQLEQVLMNLVLNARDAMPNGGKLGIRTASAILTEIDAERFAFVTPGNYVLLLVSDEGIGMDEETVAHIFDPFFTTKEHSQGSGLGLATAYGIVKQLRGYIWCESRPAQGTTFRVYLPPAHPTKAVHTPTRPSHSAAANGDETILVVEDEAAVRSLVRRVLQKNGYRVIDASNGVEALQLVETFSERIHLLLTDIVMPEMGGRDLADRLGPQCPGMKVLFMSGYTDDAIVVNHVLHPGFAFLPKPFAPDALTAKVREALES